MGTNYREKNMNERYDSLKTGNNRNRSKKFAYFKETVLEFGNLKLGTVNSFNESNS